MTCLNPVYTIGNQLDRGASEAHDKECKSKADADKACYGDAGAGWYQ